MPGKMDYFGLTHVGRKRPTNEDQFMIADLNRSLTVHQTSLNLEDQSRLFGGSQGKLLAVADGMGGRRGGKRASTLAVDAMATYVLNTMRWFFRLDEGDEQAFENDLKEGLQRCQSAILSEAEAQPQRNSMGTTLTMAYIIWPRLFVVHVGDSRCYLFHNEKLEQLTRDHSMAQLQREMSESPSTTGSPTDPEGPASHILWNILGGGDETLDPEVNRARLHIGDSLLLCSDGLTRHVSAARIGELLGSEATAEEIARQLVGQANANGGSDNTTVIVARFRELDDAIPLAKERAVPEIATQPMEPLANVLPPVKGDNVLP